ncbi:MAG TPA: GNAT family N-acetyltransferase [Puia sp.]|nr:GNAT family N-acetyltransferase [Puia sp.]
MRFKKTIETRRLKIEPIALKDSMFVKILLNTEGWKRNIGDRNINSLEDAEIYIQKIIINKNYSFRVARLKENNYPVGIVSLIKRERHQYPDIGFAFLPEYNGKGYAYEAARALLDRIIGERIWSNIIAITIPANSSSIKLLEKLGLKYQNVYEENGETLALYSLHEGCD